MKIRLLLIVTFLISISSSAFSQTLPVGISENIEDAYRREQLLGRDHSNSSYMVRPINMLNNNSLALDPDSTNYSLNNFRKLLYENKKAQIQVYALPVVINQQFNSHHPYGMNDGSMIPAKGYQMQISAGVFAKVGPLSIQFRPEYVTAENKYFTNLQESNTASEFKNADFKHQVEIDNPERYGRGNYSKAFWGQSSVRLNFDPVSFGISSENLWWGPGVRNSLLMSNNAPGFKHLTLNTTRPVNIYIGHIEAQIVAGRLDRSGIAMDTSAVIPSTPKPDDWRYFSGVVLTYQPKWVPNLFLGLDRTYIVNHEDMGDGLTDYLPFLSALNKSSYKNEGVNEEDAKKQDQYISFFARYVLPESKAEVYFQWGRNDHAYNGRDLITTADHTRAYVVGFRKLIPLKRPNEYIQFGVEVTQLEKPAGENRGDNGVTWYDHYQVRDGYTQLGQVIGAGIGPGSNQQSLDVSWVKGLKKIGLSIERTVQNNDLFYDSYTTDRRRHWVDMAFVGKFNWDYKKLVFTSQLGYIHSFNYHYGLVQAPEAFVWDWDHQDANNLHAQVSILYKF